MNKLPNDTPPTGNQDALNRIVEYFIVGERDQCKGVHSCLYRRVDGHACAVGCLVPDALIKDADKLYNGNGADADDMIDELPNVADWLRNCDVNFLMEVQDWHDEYFNQYYKLASIADRFDLQVPRGLSEHVIAYVAEN
jgi:hypothetical protein